MRTAARLVLVSALLAGCVTAPAPEEPTTGCAVTEPLVLPGERAVFVPRGPEDESVTTARVTGTDLRGKITVASERGPTEVWVVDATRYHYGDRVEVSTGVREVRVEVRPESSSPPESPTLEPTGPGDHAVVTGRILNVDPRGMVTVESPRGPIRVWVTIQPGRYCAKNWVEVRTRVRPAP